jgi:hypothetical protein
MELSHVADEPVAINVFVYQAANDRSMSALTPADVVSDFVTDFAHEFGASIMWPLT